MLANCRLRLVAAGSYPCGHATCLLQFSTVPGFLSLVLSTCRCALMRGLCFEDLEDCLAQLGTCAAPDSHETDIYHLRASDPSMVLCGTAGRLRPEDSMLHDTVPAVTRFPQRRFLEPSVILCRARRRLGVAAGGQHAAWRGNSPAH